jgi:DNA-binding transcriptional MocR family regulator
LVQLTLAISQPDGAKTVVSRISETIKAQIAEGVYPPGSRLPSSRALAADLGVSRTTVTAAYEQLAAEGYLEARQGARPQVPIGLRVEQPVMRQGIETTSPKRLSDFGQRLVGLPVHHRPKADAPVADFRYGDLAASDSPRSSGSEPLMPPFCADHPASSTAIHPARPNSARPCKAISGGRGGSVAIPTRSSW